MVTELDTSRSHLSRSRSAIWAIVPVKSPGEGSKQRLAPLLDGEARQALSRAMLEDVLDQLARVSALDGILLVSGDSRLTTLEARYPVTFHPEPGDNRDGLNGAVSAAARHLTAQGIETVLILHGDLPLLVADELTRLLACHGTGETPRATLVPDDQGDGTNALVVTPPLALPFAYGRNSFERHRQLAAERNLQVEVFPSAPLALDIDTPDDLHRLANFCDLPALRERRSCRLLAGLDLLSFQSAPAAATTLSQ